MRQVGLALLLVIGVLLSASPVFAASCPQTASISARLICENPKLAELNRQVLAVWQQVQRDIPTEQRAHRQQQQQLWLAQRDLCSNNLCLQVRFQQRLIDLVSLQRAGISFMDFPARMFDGQLADPLPDSEGPITPPANLPAGLNYDQVNAVLINGEPELAGEYVLLQSGCGPSCQQHYVLNLRTGTVLGEHFGGPCQRQLVAFQPESQLLIASQPSHNQQPSQWLYYRLRNNQLTLIHQLTIENAPAEQGCA